MEDKNKIRIDPDFHSLIPPLTDEERAGLEASLRREGCRDALVTWRGVILDGHHRHEICLALGIPFSTVEAKFDTRNEAKAWIIENQFGRRNLTPYQRAELALKLEPLIASRAKEKQRQGGLVKVPQISAEPIETRRVVAHIAGVSHDTIQKVSAIIDNAPEPVKERLRIGHPSTSINRVYQAIVKSKRRAQQIETLSKVGPLPPGKYDVIVVDPPWPYEKGNDNPEHRGVTPYPTMSIDEISALPIMEFAADNCLLWLWTTNAFMFQAFQAVKSWGFEVKTILTWVKDRMGVGSWLRGQTEHCLLATRGKPVVKLKKQSTVLHAPRRKHSEKPNQFFDLVESLCPGTKCELFSRKKRDGWTCWGGELVSSDKQGKTAPDAGAGDVSESEQ